MRFPVMVVRWFEGVVALGLAVSACGGGEPEGPTGALEEALTRARPLAAAGQSARVPLASALPHRMTLTLEIRLEPPTGVQRLVITRTVDRGPAGAFHLVDRRAWTLPSLFPDNPPRTAEDRAESIFDGKVLVTRHGDSAWLERDALDGHPQRLLTAAYDLDDVVLGGFADYFKWTRLVASETRPAEVAGLPVEWGAPGIDPSVAPRALTAEALAALRDHERDWVAWVAATHRPMRCDGEVARTADGELVLGKLEVAGVATVEGVDAPFVMRVSAAVAPPADGAFAIPAERLPEKRPRTWKMIEDVLGSDLAPVYEPRP